MSAMCWAPFRRRDRQLADKWMLSWKVLSCDALLKVISWTCQGLQWQHFIWSRWMKSIWSKSLDLKFWFSNWLHFLWLGHGSPEENQSSEINWLRIRWKRSARQEREKQRTHCHDKSRPIAAAFVNYHTIIHIACLSSDVFNSCSTAQPQNGKRTAGGLNKKSITVQQPWKRWQFKINGVILIVTF